MMSLQNGDYFNDQSEHVNDEISFTNNDTQVDEDHYYDQQPEPEYNGEDCVADDLNLTSYTTFINEPVVMNIDCIFNCELPESILINGIPCPIVTTTTFHWQANNISTEWRECINAGISALYLNHDIVRVMTPFMRPPLIVPLPTKVATRYDPNTDDSDESQSCPDLVPYDVISTRSNNNGSMLNSHLSHLIRRTRPDVHYTQVLLRLTPHSHSNNSEDDNDNSMPFIDFDQYDSVSDDDNSSMSFIDFDQYDSDFDDDEDNNVMMILTHKAYGLPNPPTVFENTIHNEDIIIAAMTIGLYNNDIQINDSLSHDHSVNHISNDILSSYITSYESDTHNNSEPIFAHIDTGSKANLIQDKYLHRESFKSVRPCSGVTVTGIDSNAPPITATHTGYHPILGKVYFGRFACNLIGVPALLERGLELHCSKDKMDIIKSSNHSIVYTGYKNKHGLFSTNIAMNEKVIKAYTTHDLISPGIHIDIPLHASEISRAKEARELHDNLGHPSDAVLKDALTNNVYVGLQLVPKDIDNSRKLFGSCPACLEGKMKEPAHHSSNTFQSDVTGENLYVDLKQTKVICLQKHTQFLVVKDYYSGYMTITGLKDKSIPSVINGLNSVIAFYSSYGHITKRLIFDHESIFIAMSNKVQGIVGIYTPAGLHNRLVERGIKNISQRKRCCQCDLPYTLDPRLEVLEYENAAKMSNRVPNERTGPSTTPYMMVTGKRPDIPPFKFGQCVMAYSKSSNTSERRMECAVFIRHDYTNDHIVYNPATGNLLSRHQVEKSDVYPAEWKWNKRAVMLPNHIKQDIPDPKFTSEPLSNITRNDIPIHIISNETTASTNQSINNSLI